MKRVLPVEWLFTAGVYLVWLFHGKSLSKCLRCGNRQGHKQQKKKVPMEHQRNFYEFRKEDTLQRGG